MFIKNKFKKFITSSALAITSLAVLSSPTVSYASTFSDVKENHWSAEMIEEAYERGIVGGYGNGKFGPNDALTYEQFMAMLGSMISNYEFIEDKVSGCNAYIFDTKEIAKQSNGDVDKSYKVRQDYYLENKIFDVVTQESEYIKNNDLEFSNGDDEGSCPQLGWDFFQASPYVTPYAPNSHFLSNQVQKYAIDNMIEVPFVASVISQYSLMHNDGKNLSDWALNQELYIDDLYREYYVGNDDIYEKITAKYAYGNAGSKKITREDMAIILYTFLDYDNKKLLSSYQDSWNYNTDFYKLQGKLKFEKFNSSYSDIPKDFIANSYENTAFDYKHGVINIKNFILNNQKHNNYYLKTFASLPMTSRGAILAVSDTTTADGTHLLSGSDGKFKPKDSLTRAQGVAVTLRLEQYLKENFNLIERQ